MKTNLYRMIGIGRATAAAAALVSLMFGFEACKTDPVSNSYARLGSGGDEPGQVFVPVNGLAQQWFNFYSDHSAWTVEVDYLFDADLNWITVWPNRGSGDGRFSIIVDKNADTPYLREANVNIVSNGTVIQTVKVSQEAAAPRLELGMEGLTRLTFSSKAAEKTAKLNTNAIWRAEIISSSEEGNWLTLTDFASQSQGLSVTANPGDSERTAVVRFTMVGGTGELFVDLNVKQRDASTDAEFATLTTIGDILSQVGPGGGEITDNVYIHGYVTSDLSSRNFDVKRQWPVTDANSTFDQTIDYEQRYMWVQDDSGKGMMFEWLSDTYNIYELNTKVKMHLIGCTVVTDAFTGAPKIGNVEPDVVFESEASDGIAPVELDSFDNIEDYVNTLVKISPVQFALPYGTYVNINELYFNTLFTADDTRISVPYCETSRQYGHLIMDSKGNTHRLVTECTFIERYIRPIPQGSGSLTAIVTKNFLAGENHYVLRLRRDSDNEVSEDSSTRFTKIVSRFGPYVQDASVTSTVTATEGNGTLKTGVFTSLGSDSENGMYWSSTYARFITSGITVDEKGTQSPDIPQSDNIYTSAYACINANSIWNPSMASSIADSRLGGWIITLSTLGVTGDLILTFDSSSSKAGPAWMKLQWKEIVNPEDEFTTKDQWNTIIPRYELPNWDVNYHLQQYSFKLPDELKGRNKIIIRHITDFEANGTTAPARASRIPNNTASAGGTNRIGLWTLEEIK